MSLSDILAVAGLASTSIVAAIGLYFTSRTRTAVYRDQLYARQLELLPELLEIMAVLEALIGVLIVETTEAGRKHAWLQLQAKIAQFSQLAAKLALVVPAELYTAIGDYQNVAVEMFVAFGEGRPPSNSMFDLQGRGARTLVLARSAAGVNTLTSEAQSLFSADSLAKIARADPAHYVNLAREAVAQSVRQGTD